MGSKIDKKYLEYESGQPEEEDQAEAETFLDVFLQQRQALYKNGLKISILIKTHRYCYYDILPISMFSFNVGQYQYFFI